MDMTTQSIDAIVVAPAEEVNAATMSAQSSMVPLSPSTEHNPDQNQKHKSRRRLLRGLHRISSSPSLAKIRPYRSSSSRASMSCASLTSYEQDSNGAYDSDFSQQFSTAPTSVTSSPGPATPTFDARPRARTLGSRDLHTSVGVPNAVRPSSPEPSEDTIAEAEEDYFSCTEVEHESPRRPNFNFWNDMPSELRIRILSFLTPREIVRSAGVSKAWHEYCFDGQLWKNLDTTEYYRDIPADVLVKIISNAGPFVRDLNLRGCVQLREKWTNKGLAEACTNLENFSVEGCLIDRSSVHCFLLQNTRLVHINISGLPAATNAALKIIGTHCPKLEHLNVTWCQNIDTRGLRKVLEGCPRLKDLRVGEVRGWDDIAFAKELFRRNTLESLVLTNCDTLTDESLAALIVGVDGQIDWLTGRTICPPRRLKHLDLTRCRNVSDAGLKVLAHNLPYLEGLQLSKCSGLTDDSLTEVLPTLPALTHLDLEELESITNATLLSLASSPACSNLRHLSLSYCESLTDTGMIPAIRACRNLERLDLDNTRISDLTLIEAADTVRLRNRDAARSTPHNSSFSISVGLHMVVFDCPNVTWMGVREVLSRNTELGSSRSPLNYAHSTIMLKAFYTWQPTINEHSKRVAAGEFDRAKRLERKWAEYMMLGEEAAQGGRRRRRRMREALEAMAGEEGMDGGGVIRRRRARSAPLAGGGCVVM